MTLNPIRSDFPALQQKIRGQRYAYLDSAATTLKPQVVADRIHQYYLYEASNIHRGSHFFGDLGTQHFEAVRTQCAEFIKAESAEEIVFVKGTTEGINLLTHGLGEVFLRPGDEILLTQMEHHANIVPWQMMAEKKNLKITYVKLNANGELDLLDLDQKLNSKTKVFAFTGCSNVLGTINDVKLLTQKAHSVGAKVVVDAAQWIFQEEVDVKSLEIDFLVFSAHKILGPNGFGVLYGKKHLLDQLPPYQGGGSMISEVTLDSTTYTNAPFRFEAGTPNIAGAIGTGEALKYITARGLKSLVEIEESLRLETEGQLQKIPGLEIYGKAKRKGAIISFNLKGIHHSDVSQILNQQGVAVRGGHHCAQPLMTVLGVKGTVRASFSIYNDFQDVEQFVSAVFKAKEILS